MSNPYAPPEANLDAPADREPEHHPVASPPGDKPIIPKDDEFVTVYTANDVIEAEMLTQVLEAEGIPTPGFNRATGAQVGAGWMAVGHVLRVPASRKEEARQLIDAYLEGAEDALPPEAGEPEPTAPPRRSGIVTLGVAVVLAPTILGLLFGLVSFVASLLSGR